MEYIVCGGVFISLIQFVSGFVPHSNGFVHHIAECICIGQWMYLCLNVMDLLGGAVGGFVNHTGGICIPMSCRWGADCPHLSPSQIFHFSSF